MVQPARKTEHRLSALAVSRGIGVGKIVFLDIENKNLYRRDLDADEIEREIDRFRSAVEKASAQLHELTAAGVPPAGQTASGIFGVHLLILESSLVDEITSMIKDQQVSAEWAVNAVFDQHIKRQELSPDKHFKDKYLDIEDVAQRLLAALDGSFRPSNVDVGAIIVAKDLWPSLIVELAKRKPAALIMEYGGWTSHSSILAREFGVPMISGVRGLDRFSSNGDVAIVDGDKGEVIVDPSDETVTRYRGLAATAMADGQSPVLGKTTTTADGTPIIIRANLEKPDGYAAALDSGACGIGLFRSESLIRRSRSFPTEEVQVAAYSEIAETVGDAGVRIRTFDIGIDRLENRSYSAERNPSLGLRGLRLSLAQPEQFRIQIRAILRASFDKKIDVVLPMVPGISEVSHAKSIIDEEIAGLVDAGVNIGSPKLGAMIETPSAVLTAPELAAKLDFLCIGTNDLVQYLLAVDRDNDAVADWYQTLHPAVIKAIRSVIRAAQTAGIPMSVCGEMAGSRFYVPVLLGLGVRELSMNVNSIQQVRHLISAITLSDATKLVEKVESCETTQAVEKILNDHYRKNWGGIFGSKSE